MSHNSFFKTIDKTVGSQRQRSIHCRTSVKRDSIHLALIIDRNSIAVHRCTVCHFCRCRICFTHTLNVIFHIFIRYFLHFLLLNFQSFILADRHIIIGNFTGASAKDHSGRTQSRNQRNKFLFHILHLIVFLFVSVRNETQAVVAPHIDTPFLQTHTFWLYDNFFKMERDFMLI